MREDDHGGIKPRTAAVGGHGKGVAGGCSAPVLLEVLHQLSLPGKTRAI